jgi:hypothetical protein
MGYSAAAMFRQLSLRGFQADEAETVKLSRGRSQWSADARIGCSGGLASSLDRDDS